MRFKVCLLSCLALIAASCGALGDREDPSRTVTFKSASPDCLGGLAPKIERFLDGEISPSEWQAVWTCTNKSLDSFRRFVDPSSSEGFTPSDMKALLGQFLLSREEVSDELVQGFLDLKASVAGGARDRVTLGEIDLLRRLIARVGSETTPLIALLKARRLSPTPDGLLALADGVARVGESLASELSGQSFTGFSRASAEILVRELGRLNVVALPLDQVGVAFGFKRLLFAGSDGAIEGAVWPELLRTASRAVGLLAAVRSLPRELDPSDFRERIAHRLYDVALDAVRRNAGVIDFEAIDALIQELPARAITIGTMDGRGYTVDRGVIQSSLRPFFRDILSDRSSRGVSQDSLDTLFRLFLRWSAGDRHLRRIFDRYSLDPGGVTAERFASAAGLYQVGLDDEGRADVSRLVALAYDYKPLFFGEDDQVSFIPSNRHSLSNLGTMHWINLLSAHALSVYGTHANGTKVDLADLERLVESFIEIADELKVVDKTREGMTARRFGEADLFMPVSNGDGFLDEREATYYIAYLKSAFAMSNKVRETIQPLCQLPGDPEVDPELSDRLYWRKMDGRCFRREYFSRYASFWDHLPAMVTYYRVSSQAQRQAIAVNLEKAGRREGFSDSWLASYDTQGLGATLHYIESIFTRFDVDNNQELDLDETLTAYPIFRPIFARVGGINPNDPKKERLLRTAFTYTIRYGERPPSVTFRLRPKVRLKTEGPIARFGLWFLKGLVPKGWKIDSQRDRLYNIVTLLAAPVPSEPGTREEWYDPEEIY